MKIELWMLVATGVACAAGFGILAVLILALDSKVRRLTRQSGALQNALAENLKSLLADAATAARPVPVPVTPPAAPAAPIALPVAAAAIETASGEETPASRWTSERRLLVMRLAARGNPPEQIAAALRIPLQEINLFFKLNRLGGAAAGPEPAAPAATAAGA